MPPELAALPELLDRIAYLTAPLTQHLTPHLTCGRIALALIAVNLIAFALFGYDKSLAERGRWRVAEATLLFWSLVGGTPGAYAGRRLLRHKTRKEPFVSLLRRVLIVQLLALAVGAAWWVWG